MSRLTLAQQLKQLESAAPIQETDPENAYSSLGTYNPRHGEEEDEGDEARAHYGDVGKSSLRDPTLSTLSHLDAKYNSTGHGKQQQTTSNTKKVKVFDDDLSEDEDEERIFAGEDGLDASGSENDEDEGDSEDHDSEEDEEEEDEDEDDDEEEADEESENDDTQPTTHRALPTPKTAASANGNTKLDPVAAIRASKNKEIEKGRAILRQQKLFDDLVAVRISFAKAWQAGSKVPLLQPQSRAGKRSIDDVDAETDEPTGPAEALEAMNATLADNRAQMLRSLHSLSEDLFSVRERIGRALPGMIDAASGRERKRRKFDEEEVDEEERDDVIGYQTYWKSCADDSFGLLDSSHDVLVTTLNKWSTKIQAASIQQATLAGKNNGNKFSVTTAGTGVLEAIDGSLNAKASRTHSRPLSPWLPY
ncbi:hypothetical protein QFC21_002424 [Naganishia friedmannii]|uniref:Uncharacterized protein n=1 Tax=Naganishia friedmannii TaxID=89922 RepID=A0ACC2VZA0_9TREE|nr:hypothetical protein QFC21_002424 [Naganishia friedmannii]